MFPSPDKLPPKDPKERAVKKGDVSQAALVIQAHKMNQGTTETKYIDADWEKMPPPSEDDDAKTKEPKKDENQPIVLNSTRDEAKKDEDDKVKADIADADEDHTTRRQE